MRLGVLDAFTNTVSKNAKHPMESCIWNDVLFFKLSLEFVLVIKNRLDYLVLFVIFFLW